MIPSLKEIKELDESVLNEQLSSQIEETIQIEHSLSVLLKQRDLCKRKAEQIQRLQETNEGLVVDTMHKLLLSCQKFESEVKETKESLRICLETDPQAEAQSFHSRVNALRRQNDALRLERNAKEVVCKHLLCPKASGKSTIIPPEVAYGNLHPNDTLNEMNEKKNRGKGKYWTQVQSVSAFTTRTKEMDNHNAADSKGTTIDSEESFSIDDVEEEPSTFDPQICHTSEITSCDNCTSLCRKVLKRGSRIGKSRTAKHASLDDGGPNKKSRIIESAGNYFETSSIGTYMASLSREIVNAEKFKPAELQTSLEQNWKDLLSYDCYLDELKPKLLKILHRHLKSREDEIRAEGPEYKEYEEQMLNEFRSMSERINEDCSIRLENLKRGLDADVDFESKVLENKNKQTVLKHLREVDEQLKKIGCVGPDFQFIKSPVKMKPSSVIQVQHGSKCAVTFKPLPEKILKTTEHYERAERQLYLMCANSADTHSSSSTKTRITPISTQSVINEVANIIGESSDSELEDESNNESDHSSDPDDDD